jgi:MerR-like DNA binding protein
MSNEELIPAADFCTSHAIEIGFIQSLHEYGLIEIITIEETRFVHPEQLPQLEQFIRLHYELDINLAGIDAIANLLQRIEQMQNEIRMLKNRLTGEVILTNK